MSASPTPTILYQYPIDLRRKSPVYRDRMRITLTHSANPARQLRRLYRSQRAHLCRGEARLRALAVALTALGGTVEVDL